MPILRSLTFFYALFPINIFFPNITIVTCKDIVYPLKPRSPRIHIPIHWIIFSVYDKVSFFDTYIQRSHHTKFEMRYSFNIFCNFSIDSFLFYVYFLPNKYSLLYLDPFSTHKALFSIHKFSFFHICLHFLSLSIDKICLYILLMIVMGCFGY